MAKEINYNILDTLRAIRKSTGLNQEKFFQEHLAGLPGVPDRSSGASRQDWMAKMENGATQIPLSVLPVYSRLGKMSIDKIVTGSPYAEPEADPFTYADALQLIWQLVGTEGMILADNAIHITDPVLSALIADCSRMAALVKSGTLLQKDFDLWYQARLQESRVPLIYWPTEDYLFEMYTEKTERKTTDYLAAASQISKKGAAV